jgi:RND family efflux transporter MFP subunit
MSRTLSALHYRLLPLALLLMLSACSTGNGTPPPQDPPRPEVHLVATVTVAAEALAQSAVRTGTVRARREVRIHNQEEGTITELPHYEGDRVRAGEVLVRIDGALLQAQLDRATATRRQAELDIARLRELVKKRLASEDELARTETALQIARAEEGLLRTRLGYTTIAAPFDGTVTARLAEPGDVVGRHAHLLTIVDPSSLVVEVGASELLLPRLGLGDAVQLRIDALGRQELDGRIVRIHPTVDPRSRQGLVEVALDPIPPGARPGQLARVTLTAPAHPRLMVPFEALRRDAEGEFVFVLDEQARVRRGAVRSGLRLADRIEILEGLEVGQQVVVKGFLGLSEGKQVKPVG